MKISECVSEFISLWVEWLKYNDIAIDKNQDAGTRRSAAISAEKLLNKRYWLIEQINNHFEKFDK
jgi:hypothetical protein